MRIGFFTDSYYPYISGVVRSIDLFSRELRSLGHDVYIFAPDYPECKKEPYIYRFSSVPAPNVPDFRIAIPFMPNLTEKIKELNLDIIHTHSPFMMGRLASALAKKLSMPLVFTYHTNYEEFAHHLPLANKTARRLTMRLAIDFCNRCEVVIAPTPIIKDYLLEGGVTTLLEVVPTGVDIQKYQQGNKSWLRRRFRFTDEDQILLYVGRLGEDKNLYFLLEVVRELMAKHPQLFLMLVGKGNEEQDLRRLVVKWGLENRILFMGMVTPHKVVDYYLGANMFVFPSATETQGLVVLEAMAAGLPVVAINRGGPKDVVSHGKDGLLTEPEHRQFKSAIEGLLLDSNARLLMGNLAKEKAAKFSSFEMAKKLEQALLQATLKPLNKTKKKNNQL